MLIFTLLGGLHIARGAAPPTSDLRPPTSDLRPPTSDLRPPTSDIRPPTSGLEVHGFISQKARALLVYLVLTRRAHSRDKLTGLLWGEIPQKRASGNLRVALSNLRDLFPDYLIIERHHVAFDDSQPCWLDVADYEALLAAGDPASLQQATRLYRGPLLDGFIVRDAPAYEEWLLVERERLNQLQLQALHRLTRHYAERGDYPAAIETAERLLALDPWREETHSELMRLLALSGQRGAALSQYERCRRILRQEMGLEPLQETTTLYEQIRAMPLTFAPSPSTSPIWGATGPPFVGRQEEHACLIGWWNAARRGSGRLTLIAGEAGAGKTRLVEQALRYAAARGATILRGNCYEFGGGLPYQAIAQALRQALSVAAPPGLQPPTAVWLGELARLLPELRDLYAGLPAPPAADDEAARQRLFEAVARFLTCQPNPIVLFLDDLHWADSATLDLLHYLVRRAAGQSLWLIGAYRSEEVASDHPLEHLRRGLGRDHLVEHLSLAPLALPSIRELADALVGKRQGTALADFLYHECAGNPLFVMETVDALWEDGLLGKSGETLQWSGPPPASAIPRSIRDVILQRIERLSTSGRQLLAMASAVGRPFDAPLLQMAAGQNVGAALDEWLRRGIVCPTPGPCFDFSHDKIRAVIYQAMSAAQRQDCHRRLGYALEQIAAEPPPYAELAFHAEQAGQVERALHYLPLAATQARAVYAHRQALDYYDRALALAQARPERWPLEMERLSILHFLAQYDQAAAAGAALWQAWGEGRIEALLAARVARELGAIETDRRNYDAARIWAQHAQRLTEAGNSPATLREQARARHALAAVEYEQGHLERAQQLYQEALFIHQQLDDLDGQAACLKGLGQVFSRWGRYPESRQWLEQALPIFERLDNRQEQATCLRFVGANWWREGQYDAARQSYEQSLSICQAIGDQAGQAAALNGLGLVAIACDDWIETRRCWEESVALYRALGLEKRAAAGLHNLGILHTVAGDYEQAQQCLEASLALDQASGAQTAVALDLGWLGRLHLFRGDYDAARSYLDEALALDHQIGGGEEEINHLAWRGAVAYETGDWAQAQAFCEQALDLCHRHDQPPDAAASCLLAFLCLAQGNASAALELVRPLLPADQGQHAGNLYAVLGTIYASNQANGEDPIACFERALDLLRGKDRLEYAIALRRYGACLLQRGAQQQARQRLQEALDILDRLGARGERDKVARLLDGDNAPRLRW